MALSECEVLGVGAFEALSMLYVNLWQHVCAHARCLN